MKPIYVQENNENKRIKHDIILYVMLTYITVQCYSVIITVLVAQYFTRLRVK